LLILNPHSPTWCFLNSTPLGSKTIGSGVPALIVSEFVSGSVQRLAAKLSAEIRGL
jgi:hypothetical protein